MKLIVIFLVSFSVFGNENFQTGVFELYSTPKYQPAGSCDVGIRLVLDRAEYLGDIIALTNFVDGYCDLYVDPNFRVFQISKVESIGCGSWNYSGYLFKADGEYQVEIVDNRRRTCDDVVPGIIVLTETTPNGEKKVSFSYDGP